LLHIPEATLALTQTLSDEDGSARVAAARALWQIDGRSRSLVPVLTAALQDADAGWQAVLVLGEIGPEAADAVPALIATLKQEKVPRPLRTPPGSAIALGKIGVGSVPALIECLRDSQPRIRTSAAIALGFVGPKAEAAVPALTGLLSDSDLEVRQAAALGLGDINLHIRELPPALAALTHDDDIFVSASAASLLRKIDPDAPLTSSE
jgi:HEAT repeat protein